MGKELEVSGTKRRLIHKGHAHSICECYPAIPLDGKHRIKASYQGGGMYDESIGIVTGEEDLNEDFGEGYQYFSSGVIIMPDKSKLKTSKFESGSTVTVELDRAS